MKNYYVREMLIPDRSYIMIFFASEEKNRRDNGGERTLFGKKKSFVWSDTKIGKHHLSQVVSAPKVDLS